MDDPLKIMLGEVAGWIVLGGVVGFLLWRVLRTLGAVNLRISQLAGRLGAGVEVSPRCRKCDGPLQAASSPYEGQTHYCPTCALWAVVVAVPGPRGGDR